MVNSITPVTGRLIRIDRIRKIGQTKIQMDSNCRFPKPRAPNKVLPSQAEEWQVPQAPYNIPLQVAAKD